MEFISVLSWRIPYIPLVELNDMLHEVQPMPRPADIIILRPPVAILKYEERLPLGLAIAALGLAVAYGFSRTKRHALAVALGLICLSIPPFVGVVSGPDDTPARVAISLAWLALPLLLSGLFFSLRSMYSLLGAYFAGMLLLWAVVPGLTSQHLFLSLGYVGSVSALIAVVVHVGRRNLLRAVRRSRPVSGEECPSRRRP